MPEKNITNSDCEQTTIEVRVRYPECDPMGVAHHSIYPIWFEQARVELLREGGVAYKDLEAQSVYFVVAKLNIRYRRPAYYDQILRVEVAVTGPGHAKIEHTYKIYHEDQLLADAQTTIVCVDAEGKPQLIPPGIISH